MMERLRVAAIALALSTIGCSKSDTNTAKTDEKPKQEATTADAAGGPADKESDAAPGAPAGLIEGTFSKDEIPESIKVEGEVTGGLRFTDRNGENWVVFSKKEPKSKEASISQYLYAGHWVAGSDGIKQLRDVRDKVEDCEFDITVAIDDKSVEVTDLDNDGIGEVGFGYQLQCTSDVSPATYKLLMLENGDKYIIRGTTRIVMEGEAPMGGEMKVDKSLKKGPPEFLEHAKKRWPKLTTSKM